MMFHLHVKAINILAFAKFIFALHHSPSAQQHITLCIHRRIQRFLTLQHSMYPQDSSSPILSLHHLLVFLYLFSLLSLWSNTISVIKL